MRWLELTMDYRCNNRCVGCFSVQDEGPSMTATEIARALTDGRREGARSLWLGGGEPTLRKDLLAIAREARRVGFERIKLQTNGMMLAYADYARRCAEAGITEVSFSIKGSTASLHDELTRTPGCHALMVEGMANAAAAGLGLEADVLAYRKNVHDLGAMVRTYRPLGIQRFRIWLLSSADSVEATVRDEVPRITDVVSQLVRLRETDREAPIDLVQSLHTPPCTVPEAHRSVVFDVAGLEMRVVNPGGHAFPLEESPIEGGQYLPRCSECTLRSSCRGIRADYLSIHGDPEFQPVLRDE